MTGEVTISLLVVMGVVVAVFLLVCLVVAALYFISELLQRKPIGRRRPGKVTYRVLDGEHFMLKFVLVLPAKSASDVVERELTVAVGGVEAAVYKLDGDVLESEALFGVHNDSVSGQLVDIDGAGNKSEPSVFDLVLVDNIAPPMPGSVGIVVIDDNYQPGDDEEDEEDEGDEGDEGDGEGGEEDEVDDVQP
jgi:hypothetical protein